MAHVVGSWVIDRISLYRDPRTGTQYIGNWASRDYKSQHTHDLEGCRLSKTPTETQNPHQKLYPVPRSHAETSRCRMLDQWPLSQK